MSESTPEDRFEQAQSPGRDSERSAPPDLPLEAPDADAVEQSRSVGPGQHVADEGGDAGDPPLETDRADAAEQAVVVELDDADEVPVAEEDRG